MNGFKIAETAFIAISAGLAAVSLPALFTRAPSLDFPRTREAVALSLTIAGLVLIGFVLLIAFLALYSQNPYTRVVFMALFRGQYAWAYWLFALALAASQVLWFDSLRARPRWTFFIALVCLVGVLANTLARLIWASH